MVCSYNKSFAEGEVLTAAVLDRLLHRGWVSTTGEGPIAFVTICKQGLWALANSLRSIPEDQKLRVEIWEGGDS